MVKYTAERLNMKAHLHNHQEFLLSSLHLSLISLSTTIKFHSPQALKYYATNANRCRKHERGSGSSSRASYSLLVLSASLRYSTKLSPQATRSHSQRQNSLLTKSTKYTRRPSEPQSSFGKKIKIILIKVWNISARMYQKFMHFTAFM